MEFTHYTLKPENITVVTWAQLEELTSEFEEGKFKLFGQKIYKDNDGTYIVSACTCNGVDQRRVVFARDVICKLGDGSLKVLHETEIEERYLPIRSLNFNNNGISDVIPSLD